MHSGNKDAVAMTALLDLRERLQETHAAISRIERAAASHPDDETLSLTVKSLRQRQEKLEAAFAEMTDIEHLDVCSYRLISEQPDRFPLSSVAATFSGFQQLFSTVYDALKSGPKVRARLAPEIVQQSSFDFGYVSPGSLEFVFTIPNERLLLIESELDQSIRLIFEMAKAKTPEEVAQFAKRVGVASIRRLYAWTERHTEHNMSAEIKWRRREDVRSDVLVQTAEMRGLIEIIKKTSEETSEEIWLTGNLVGLDIDTNFFHMQFPDADDIKGRIGESFNRERQYRIPSHCKANITRRTKIHYSIEREEIHYDLISLNGAENDQNA